MVNVGQGMMGCWGAGLDWWLIFSYDGLYRPYRAESRFVEDQGFREAVHPWLSCGRTVGALVSGTDQDQRERSR
jgi:hypothetical protein